MVMDAAVERFVEQSPITVMARLALQRALAPETNKGQTTIFHRHIGKHQARTAEHGNIRGDTLSLQFI